MNKLDKDYQELVKDVLENGTKKIDRTGTGTISVFGRQIRHSMSDGFPLLTTKKLSFHNIWTELVWFLNGDTNIRWLLNQKNYIWVGDAYKNYVKICSVADSSMNKWFRVNEDESLSMYTRSEFIEKIKTDDEFCKEFGNMGPIYGKQWRKWTSHHLDIHKNDDGSGLINFRTIDQIKNIINELKENPDSRRMLLNAWNVGDIDDMKLPPCHYSFQVYTRELSWEERKKTYQNGLDGILTEEWADKIGIPKRAISLMWNQRSCDLPLGIPYNIASYGLLLMMLAEEVNMLPDELIGNLGDVHIYLNQIDGIKEQLNREPFPLPKVTIQDGIMSNSKGDFKLTDYISHPKIDLPLSN